MIKPQQAAPLGRKHRVSSDNVWPLRGADGKTFAERRNDAACSHAFQFDSVMINVCTKCGIEGDE